MDINMLEVKYYKDYRHNYMILQCRQGGAARSYQYRILTSDKIKEILRCYVRHINGATYYYYDISSRTTLENMYQGKQMSYEQVKDVLWQIHGICDKLAGYFMEESKLVLLPEHIYYDFTDHKYIGLYYPDYQAVGAEAYRPLMDFLLEHIDTENERLTENMYRIYELSEEPHFMIEDALRILEEEEKPDKPMQEPSVVVTEVFEEPEELPAVEQHCEMPQKQSKSLFYPIFAILTVIGMAGALTVYNIYELTQKEEILLGASIAIMGICLLICIRRLIKGVNSKPAREAERNQPLYHNPYGELSKESNGKLITEYYQEPGQMSLEHVICKNMDIDLAVQDVGNDRTENYEARSSCTMASGNAFGDNKFGNTVFFDESKIEECKLYAMDRRNKRHIELKQFPCTIGKMAGCVDYVLSDNSVSRIHARFDRQDGKLLLTDMNSTNGTYKNGLRMQPQETVEIEPGDEIRFGNLNYCYR